MAIQFTDNQTRVLNARHHNVLVSAAAGSGKTAVLVERIIRMISEDEHPLDIDRLLVVTFTRAAAAQMRERIAGAISKRLTEHPDDRHLQRQETLLHRARITTIDSFCTFLLRNNCSEIDLDPGFRQIDENEAALIRGDCLERYLEEQYAAALNARSLPSGPHSAAGDAASAAGARSGSEQPPDPARRDAGIPEDTESSLRDKDDPVRIAPERFTACVEYFCPGGNDAGLEKLIRRLFEAADSHSYPEVWLEERKRDYRIADEAELLRSGWYRQMLLERLDTFRETLRQYEVMLTICREPDGPDLYLNTIEEEHEFLSGIRVDDAADTASLRWALLEASRCPFSTLPAIRKKADKDRIDTAKKERVQNLRSSIKDNLKKLGEELWEEPALTVQRMQAAAGPLETLIDLTLGYRAAYQEAKKERNVVDFSDLEHYALEVLIERAPDGTLSLRRAALSYREYYDEVLIDEYQDSNEVQELLLSAITGEPSAGFVDTNPADFDIDAAHRVADPIGETASADFSSGCVPHTRQHGEPSAGFVDTNPADFDVDAAHRVADPIITGSYARFMVGDVKQSIYRFRNARPEIFQRKFDTYTVAGEGAGSEERAAGSGKTLLTERIDLDQNFRSRTEVLDAANGVCEKIMRREIGGVEYDDVVSLKPGASYPDPVPERDGSSPYQAELLLVDGCKGDGKDARKGGGPQPENAGEDGSEDTEPADALLEELSQLDSTRREALAVAQRIHELVGVLPVYDRDTGEQHPARFRDIVILMRSTSGRQDAYREIFEKEGIPLYLEYKGGYFSAGEVRTVLELLNVIDNPRQDIPLYSVLSGYYGGFTQDEIAQIRALGSRAERTAVQGDSAQTVIGQSGLEDGKLYGSLLLAAGRNRTCDITVQTHPPREAGSGRDPADAPDPPAQDDAERSPEGGFAAEDVSRTAGDAEDETLFSRELRERCAGFLDRLSEWRELSRTASVSELIGHLVRSTGYEDYVRALPSGQRRAANLRSLLVKADAFEKTDRAGLFRFLRYIEQMHAFDVDDGEAGVIDEHADVVRLTTIHKSKGLEYPICFVCGLGTRYAYKRDTSGDLIADADAGLGVVYMDTALRCSVGTLRQRAVADKIDRDSLGEELRVLYVAMTRAQEKLILTGYAADAEKLLEGIDLKMAAVDSGAPHLPVSLIRSSGNYLTLVLESMALLRAGGREPIRLKTVPVSELRLSELEDQLTLGELHRALLLTEQGDLAQLPAPDVAARLERQFAFRYPYENLTGLYTKTTVTELKRAAMVDEGLPGEPCGAPQELYPDAAYQDMGESGGATGMADELPVPKFTLDRPKTDALTGAARGTAVHRICELIDYRVWSDPSAVTVRMFEERAAALLGAGEVPRSYACVMKPRIFLPFLHSDIASRMAAADAKGLLQREQPFVLGIAANRLNPEFPQEETILIQGIIDAFFLEEDMEGGKASDPACAACDAAESMSAKAGSPGRHIVLVDYKTDRVTTGQELIERYRVQMDYYAEALESMLHLPVAQRILYSFALQQEVYI